MTRKIKMRFLFFGVSLLLPIIGWLLYARFGHEFIKAMYDGRSIGILNNFIKGQSLHPVQDYFREVELFFLLATFYCAFVSLLAIKAKEARISIVICAVSFLGAIAVLVGTFPYGIGICPDGITYVTVAKNLLSGNGYICFRGDALIDFPPLFPTVLAFLGLAGIDPVTGSRIFNAAVFGAIIFASGQLFRVFIRSRALVILGVVAVLLSVPLLFISMSAWTEPLFILLVVVGMIYLARFFSKKHWSALILVSIIVALACMQRYIGVTLAVSVFLSIVFLLPKASVGERLKYGIVFLIIAVTPLFVWILRNYLLAKTFLNLTFPPNFGLLQNIYSTCDVLTTWLIPEKVPFGIRIAAVAAMAAMIVYIRYHLCLRQKRNVTDEVSKLLPIGIFMAVYTVSLIGAGTLIDADKIEDRYLSPLYVFAIFFVLIGVDGIVDLASKSQKNKKAAGCAVVMLFAIWLFYPCARVLQVASRWMRNGFQVYTTATWRDSSLIQWLRIHQLDGALFSNCPNAVYLLTDARPNTSHKRCHGTNPRDSKKDELNKFRETFQLNKSMSQRMYLVWFSQRCCREYECTLDNLRSVFVLEEIAALSDGAVYRFKSEK